MEITYLGHSCFILEAGSYKILFDPYITPNNLAKEIDVDKLLPDYILLSHGHHDHMADVERIVLNSNAKIISNFEISVWLEKKGIKNTHCMGIGGKWTFDFGTVKMVNAVHSSSMHDGSYGGSAAGYVVEAEGKAFYYAGDTALTKDMQLIGERYNIDFAFLPIGDNFTMDIQDAIIASDYVKTSKIIPMHYDTFPYIKIDHKHVKELAMKSKKELILLNIGEKIIL